MRGLKGLKEAVTRQLCQYLDSHPVMANAVVSHLLQTKYGIEVPPTHYYSPLPDVKTLLKRADGWNRASALTGINMNTAKQCQLLDNLERVRELA
jgi:hypothetical protein